MTQAELESAPMAERFSTGDAASRTERLQPGETPRRHRRVNFLIVGVLVLSLLASSGARHWAMALQDRASRESPYSAAGAGAELAGGQSSLGSLDSYFLILMLGGLRGPLVMFLWSEVENQKNNRALADVDTMIELIRLLQPEFDSVHIFQAWNKAYNISAQIASLPTKYAVIVDAIRYLENVDRARPNNLNILLSLNQMYQHKLGVTAGDNVYYRRAVREDTKWRQTSNRPTGAFDQHLRPILDQQGNVLPELTTPRVPRPANLSTTVILPAKLLPQLKAAAEQAGVTLSTEQLSAAEGATEAKLQLPEADARRLEPLLADQFDILFIHSDWNDGSPMQYLGNYGPFPAGVSTFGLGFNYLKRGQVIMNRTNQRPAQGGGPMIIDSRPGVELRGWMEDEWEYGVNAEALAVGRKPVTQRLQKFDLTADLGLDEKIVDPVKFAEAQSSIALAARLAHDSREEFQRHLNNDIGSVRGVGRFQAQIEEVEAMELLLQGEKAYLAAMVAPPQQRQALLTKAREYYDDGLARYRYVDLRYYIPGEVEPLVFTGGVKRLELKSKIEDRALIAQLYKTTMDLLPSLSNADQNVPERADNSHFINRAVTRISSIDAALRASGAAATQP